MREEGPAALYKGFAPKVLRLAPGGGVLLLVVEFTLGVFRKGEFWRITCRLLLTDLSSYQYSPWTALHIDGCISRFFTPEDHVSSFMYSWIKVFELSALQLGFTCSRGSFPQRNLCL